MSGVEILNQTTVYEQTMNFIPLWVCLIIGGIVGFLIAFFDLYDIADGIGGIIVGAIVGAILGITMSLGTVRTTDEISYIKYQVTVSDDVNFNEFCNRYEILDQDGKIFTIKERGN